MSRSSVTFPEEYGVETLAGKAASFAVKIKEIRTAERWSSMTNWPRCSVPRASTTCAKIEERIDRGLQGCEPRQAQAAAARRARRAARASSVPAGMVELEFEAIWKQLEDEMKRTEAPPCRIDGEQTEEEARAEYRGIAERRVRLGSHPVRYRHQERGQGRAAGTAAGADRPGAPLSWARSGRCSTSISATMPAALEQLRAPMFEDKVVDFIIELANVSEDNGCQRRGADARSGRGGRMPTGTSEAAKDEPAAEASTEKKGEA